MAHYFSAFENGWCPLGSEVVLHFEVKDWPEPFAVVPDLSDPLHVGAVHVRAVLGCPTFADCILSAVASALFGWLP